MFTKLKKSNFTKYRRIALCLSLFLIIAWAVLGTGTSLAWFKDTSNDVNNIFHFADFEIEVSQRLENGDWDPIDSTTKIFDEEALYEPGYTQLVYLKVDNKGSVPFEFKTAVSVTDYKTAFNVFGQEFNLQDYLKFGIQTFNDENAMDTALENRELARSVATMDLNHYSTKPAILQPGKSAFVALIVHMPEGINNIANHNGNSVPEVKLGVIIKADQVVD